MWSLKLGRGPSFQRAVAGLVVGLFGVLWAAFSIEFAAALPVPYVWIVFLAAGVVVMILGWSQAVYHFMSAANQQRYAEYDFVRTTEDVPPRHPIIAPQATNARTCAACSALLEPSFRFCPMCGKPA